MIEQAQTQYCMTDPQTHAEVIMQKERTAAAAVDAVIRPA
jgi:hypothetical protein